MKIQNLLLFAFTLISTIAFGEDFSYQQQKDSIIKKNIFSNIAPILTATGNQIFCPGSPMKIVTSMNFNDPDDVGVTAVYIQISTGYVFGEDKLILTGSHPTIANIWDINTGKMTLVGISGQPTYIELKAAIEDIEYSSTSTQPSGIKKFSISIGQANYLPSNGHYYEYVPNIGITWTNAKVAAQNNIYYGLQGYLATITAADEAQIAGEQASGAGWIGGSDEQQEGTWKWMTGPEAGTNMIFTFWNTGEPNNLNDEDYAHITAPGVGISGSWNDLSNTGDTSGNYQPKGYIVEYGGMPGDPIIQISTSSTITIPFITSSSAASNCNFGNLTLQATSNIGTINWYQSITGGTSIGSGTSFTTPMLNNTTTYYVDSFPLGCTTGTRTAIVATINNTPIISVTSPNSVCGNNSTTISAATTTGIINWFSSATATTPIATGINFTTPILNQNTTYYAEGNNNGCVSNRIPITVLVYPLPIVTNETNILCENSTLTLDAGISNVSYLWSTSETTKQITVSTPGNYTVTVTTPFPQNCSSTKTINVILHNIPQIQEVIVENNTATIIVNGFGSFEYSIDGINYQNSNEFIIEDGGKYIAYVREKFNCGFDFEPFVIISIPKFFTPNNDGNNDIWTIKGLVFYPKAEVKIFDRFGKILTLLNAKKYYWDGTINGKSLLSDDYWYVFKIDENSPEVKGHFALIR
jgi:gliding motility-associated-like protein